VNYQGVQWFAEEFESLDGSTAGFESVQQGSTTDFRSVLSRILSQDPDLLYLYTYGPDPGAITQQARQLGYEGEIMGYSGIPVPAFVDVAGPEAAEGARATTGYFDPNGTDAATKRYIESWREYQNADVDPAADLSFYHATLYDSVHVFAQAAEHLVDGDGDLSDPRQLQDAIYEVGEFEDMVTGTAVYEEGNAIPVKPLGVVEVQDGSWVLIDQLDC
jgi:branched-chain amino acid transport system substrate-binding protein